MTKFTSDNLDLYKKKRNDYEDFAKRVAKILADILDIEKVNYAIIESRGKTIKSIREGIVESKNSEIDIDDLAGARVVGYVKLDVDKIIKVIKDNFAIDDSKTKDKSAELAVDQTGYRAIHLYGELQENRLELPEFKKFRDMVVEIQVKTLLEHTWASIEHDRNYKYKGLPEELKRDLYITSALLEKADKDFDETTKKIDAYIADVKNKLKLEKFVEIVIDPLSLKRFVSEIIPESNGIELRYGFDQDGLLEVKELNKMGIYNLKQLKDIIPDKFTEKMDSIHEWDDSNITKFVFVLLCLTYNKKYYELVKDTRAYAVTDEYEKKYKEYSKLFQ